MRLITDRDHLKGVLEDGILKARQRVWIATANVKNLHMPGPGRRSIPLLHHLEKLQRNGVSIRLLHGTKPSGPFLNTLAELTELHQGDGFEMQLCPRVHSKIVIVDNLLAYTGSANLTGAGLGAKSEKKRNFECGVITDDPAEIQQLETYFDSIWMGSFCKVCGRREICPGPVV